MEAIGFYETGVTSYKYSLCHIPEDGSVSSLWRMTLKCHKIQYNSCRFGNNFGILNT